MKRIGAIGVLALAVLLVRPAPASADLTGFLGVSSTPSSRSAKGVSIGVGLVVVGFEFEYAKISEDEPAGAPELTTGMGNVVVMTPSFKIQLYGTTGGGIFHETSRTPASAPTSAAARKSRYSGRFASGSTIACST
jgi:hypothetical protein